MNNISHITLKSSDIKKSHDFYCKVFDCDLEWDDNTTFSLLSAGFPVWIVEDKRVGTESHLHHFAFGVSEVDLNKIVERLDKNKIEHSGIKKFMDQYLLIEVKDPDGIIFEFFVD